MAPESCQSMRQLLADLTIKLTRQVPLEPVIEKVVRLNGEPIDFLTDFVDGDVCGLLQDGEIIVERNNAISRLRGEINLTAIVVVSASSCIRVHQSHWFAEWTGARELDMDTENSQIHHYTIDKANLATITDLPPQNEVDMLKALQSHTNIEDLVMQFENDQHLAIMLQCLDCDLHDYDTQGVDPTAN